jgi:N-methylhydantoinase B/oxoprolinase/acetone carboxylase alpha subunit
VISHLAGQLQHIIDPDYGLLDQLISRRVLKFQEVEEIRAQLTASRRSRQLLDHITEKSDNEKVHQFLEALTQTDQQHVVNAIRHNGGK